jgi:streptogramin lyase
MLQRWAIGGYAVAVALAVTGSARPSATPLARLEVTGSVPVKSDRTSRIAFGAGAVWVPDDATAVARVDPTSTKVTAQIRTKGHPGQAAVGAGALWVTTTSPAAVARIDVRTKRTTASVHLARNPVTIAFGGNYVWAAASKPSPLVIAVDASTTRVVTDVSPRATAIAAGTRVALTVSPDDPQSVYRIDAKTANIRYIPIDGVGPGHGAGVAVAAGLGAVWVLDAGGFVYRVDPKTSKQVAKINVFSKPGVGSITAGRGFVWVGTGRSIVKIDPTTNTRIATSLIGRHPAARPDGFVSIAVGGGAVWALNSDDSKLYRIATS